MAAALPFATSGISALLGGIGATKGTKSTYDQKSSSTQEGVLQGKQNKVNKLIGANLMDWLKLGPNVSQGDRDTMRGQVNDQADAATERVSADAAARGMSNSGTKGRSFKDIQLARTKSFQTGEANLQSQAMQRFMQAMGIGLQYDQPRQFNSSSTSSGTQVGGQQSPFSAAGSGLGDLSSLLFMRNMGALSPVACWIAEEVYGRNDWRVTLVRNFLAGKARRSLRWLALLSLYQIFGRFVAAVVRRSSVLRVGFKWLFDQVVFSTVS